MNTTKVCFYGSLRRGHYNCRGPIDEMTRVKEHDTVSGYYMRTHGGYPAIFESTNPDDKVVVEVVELTSVEGWETLFESINRMEFGAGYFRRLVTTDSGEEAWIYVMPHEDEDFFPYHVDTGDWNEYKERWA